ncbi:MAG: DNA-3-methyladenine glycosylase [Candidatus Spechtbacterales bacterium]|nr:DNA-3-methyladenine glycosylase [Candidatus Spechtbacterales bacterium]
MAKTRKILTNDFFNRPTLEVAENLIGKYLIRKLDNKELAFKITEVEAYDGFEDKASHAHKGKTPRTEIMFREAGLWYVYLVYGMHWMLNIVTGPKEYPAAVLIRGTEEVSGPGRLTKKLRINKDFNYKMATPETGLWIEDKGDNVDKQKIKTTSRIGVDYAGEWAKKPYRFILDKQKEN